MSSKAREIGHLVDALFASVVDDEPWIAFLRELEVWLPCHHATMLLRRPREGDVGVLIAGPDSGPAVVALQREHYRNSPFLELPEGKTYVLNESELRARHSDYYRYVRCFSPTTDLIGVNLLEPRTGMTFRLRAARIDGEPGFGNKERALIDGLIPRLRTAIAISARIALQDYRLRVLDDTVGQVSVGTMVLDDVGRVLIKNQVLDRVVQTCDGFYVRNGVLHCNDPRDDRALRTLLRWFRSDNGDSSADRTLKVRRGGERYWSVLLKPSVLRPGLEDGVVSAVVMLVRDATPRVDVTEGALIEKLSLTRAEAALAVRLIQGQSVADVASALGISRCTARVQLASIFARTGVHRQAQLVSHALAVLSSDWG